MSIIDEMDNSVNEIMRQNELLKKHLGLSECNWCGLVLEHRCVECEVELTEEECEGQFGLCINCSWLLKQ